MENNSSYSSFRKKSLLGYIECKPKAVILGAKCEGKDREQIINIARKLHIEIYEMYMEEFIPLFSLNIREV